jgi:hypothetical protein
MKRVRIFGGLYDEVRSILIRVKFKYAGLGSLLV